MSFCIKRHVNDPVKEILCDNYKGITFTLKELRKSLKFKFGKNAARVSKVLDLRKNVFRLRRNTYKFQHARKIVKPDAIKR